MDSFLIPSDSMNRGILRGDYILINKLEYGPVWPRSPMEIPWISFLGTTKLWYEPFHNIKWKYNRWPKRGNPKLNEVLIFQAPWSDDQFVIKRCKGLPGDTIQLVNDHLMINNDFKQESEMVSYDYESVFNSFTLVELNSTILPVSSRRHKNEIRYKYKLHPELAKEIQNKYGVQVLQVCPYEDRADNNFGPIIIPCKGLTVNLNNFKNEIELFKRSINEFEETTLDLSNDTIFINGIADSIFTFKNNYYFMMGDNRHNSQDSRVWGFVPEQRIIGKAVTVLFSTETPSRIMVPIN